MDGDLEGDLKKSVKELEMFDPKALEECKRLAKHYSKQLLTIYQNKEDSFFLPNSTGSSNQTANSGRMLHSYF
ncbi:hypothetical protein BVC80_8981g28 [Macleaya cordata]|uniref:Uncharacterized protein n=1 Tax=Macleaya cordata TaxID=56857 RepID=A0A200Q7C5_MACCD|nr:hypothetical protein BVC80_8981g28 [Macleaya cordata]